MYTYKYTGDIPTVFIQLRQNDETWVPSNGDTIDWPETIAHPLLELVEKATASKKGAVKETVNEPVEPEQTESPVSADESKEN